MSRTDHVQSPSFCSVLYQTHTKKKKTVQGVESVKQETAGKDVSLVLGTWDQQESWHVSLECYLAECVT